MKLKLGKGVVKRTLAWLLTGALVFSSFPLTVSAEEGEEATTQEAATIESVDYTSPVIDGNNVTFNYLSPEAGAVYVAGNMNSWNSEADLMVLDSETGIWSLTMTLDAGSYEYKFVEDGNWVNDPKNDNYSGWNNAFVISNSDEGDDEGQEEQVAEYTYTIYYLDENHQNVDDASLWIWENNGAGGVQYFFDETATLEDGNTWLKATVNLQYTDLRIIPRAYSDWSWQAGTSEYLNADMTKETSLYIKYGDATVYTSISGEDITDPVEEEKTLYTYTIYYYDQNHQNTNDSSLWIWTDGVGGTQYFFDEAVTLEDGNSWLKASVTTEFSKMYIIPRAYSDWSWQDSDKVYTNAEENKEVTLYLVNEDNNVYTSIPEIKTVEKRYVLVEYTREAGDYDNWEIYTWNSGYDTDVKFTDIAGKRVAFVPVKAGKDSISFCMRRKETGNAWAEKDGGDHSVSIPLDQTVVKAQFIQGKGIVGNTPYNTGYETDVDNDKVVFYYRNDSLYLDYNEQSLEGKVNLLYDGETYAMEYDSANERYYYELELISGDHSYGYMVDGELILDKYNEDTVEVEGVTYSKFGYIKAEADIKLSLSKEEINYNENAVLSVEVSYNKDDISTAEVYADLSEIGLSNHFVIDTELMAGTISVKEGTTLGEKEIPVTVKDNFGNYYYSSINLEIVERDKSDDFDWDEAVIYFAVTDRFFDGDSSNNDAYNTGDYNKEMGSMYHGGDFAGLEAKLDYLKELGVNTIWITPIVENTHSVGTSNDSSQTTAAYHGYWATDFESIDAHLGTEEEFAALLEAVHAKGMKLMVDVVLNHAGYSTEDVFNNTYLDKNMLRDSSNTIKGDDKKDGLAGLPDFVTEDSEVRDLLIAWQTNWISKYDVDYYRVDTVKHVEDTTWKAFKNALTLIDPEFKMIGEYSGAGYATNAGQLKTGQMDSLLDFDFNDQALNFVTGSLSNVESFLEDRNANIDNTAMMGSFLGSHDEDGFIYRLQKERGKSSTDAYALAKVAAALQITAKGQPVIYYGEELGQTGANNWPYQTNRYDFDWSQVSDSNDMLTHYEKLLSIRNEYTEVFAKGDRYTVAANESNGTIVVARSYDDSSLYLGFNVNTSKEATVEVTGLVPGVAYKDVYNGLVYYANDEGKLDLFIPAAANGGIAVLAEANLPFEEKNGNLYYVVDGKVQKGAGLIQVNDNFYYVMWNGVVVRDRFGYLVSKTNGLELQAGKYVIDENGIINTSTGLIEYNGDTYFVNNGVISYGTGVKSYGGNYYYVLWNGHIVKNSFGYLVSKTNATNLEAGKYYIDENGVINTTTGLFDYKGNTYVLRNGIISYGTGVEEVDGYFYYVMWNGQVVKKNNQKYLIVKTNDSGISFGYHLIDEQGRILDKNGEPYTK